MPVAAPVAKPTVNNNKIIGIVIAAVAVVVAVIIAVSAIFVFGRSKIDAVNVDDLEITMGSKVSSALADLDEVDMEIWGFEGNDPIDSLDDEVAGGEMVNIFFKHKGGQVIISAKNGSDKDAKINDANICYIGAYDDGTGVTITAGKLNVDEIEDCDSKEEKDALIEKAGFKNDKKNQPEVENAIEDDKSEDKMNEVIRKMSKNTYLCIDEAYILHTGDNYCVVNQEGMVSLYSSEHLLEEIINK